ncbi:MAG: DMT family transporter [Deltaproteobacteria bacterium]|nr:DMT family transporter [Deltaproteobacteria bacterium]
MPSGFTATSSATASARPLALAAVAVAVLTWGWSNVVIKAVSTTGLVASFYRLWFAIPLLWLLPVIMPSTRARLTRSWLTASLAGGALFAVHQILFFSSLKLTSVANVTIIGALQPALVLLVAGRLFAERASAGAVISALVAVAGTILVIAGSAGTPHWSPLGDALATVNLFAFTAYFLASKHFRASVGATEYVLGMTTVAGLLMMIAALATKQDLLSPRGWDWPFLLFIAVLPGTLGHFLTNWAHPHLPAFLLSVMLLAVPVIATSGAAVFLDESLNLTQVAGGSIVLAAIGTLVQTTAAPAADELAESAAETDAP